MTITLHVLGSLCCSEPIIPRNPNQRVQRFPCLRCILINICQSLEKKSEMNLLLRYYSVLGHPELSRNHVRHLRKRPSLKILE